MGFFSSIFKNKKVEKSAESKITFVEKDNLGTQHDTKSKATAYWMGERMSMTRKDPFILYTFKNEKDARDSLLELPCIHVAQDSKKLICTERLIYGYYETGGSYEAILCGDNLTIELFEQALDSFTRHGGIPKNSLKPTRHANINSKQDKAHPEKVYFVKDQYANNATYKVYNGPDEKSAMSFLQQNPVTKDFYYLVVETPEGNFCRDKMGIYKEDV